MHLIQFNMLDTSTLTYQVHIWSFYPQDKSVRYTSDRRLGEPMKQPSFGEEKQVCLCWESNPISCRRAGSLAALSTELCRLIHIILKRSAADYIYIYICAHYISSRHSAVHIAIGCGLDDGEVGLCVPVRSRIFSSPRHPDRFWGASSLQSNGYWGLSPLR
jgi:hypothetical protein